MTGFRSIAIAATLLLVAASPASAGDGQSEINQTCAVQTGCFAGDTAGFPVTITTPGSYRLTGNLAVTTDVDGIRITASYVTLNLAGFEISGTNACTGTGGTLSCGTGTGSGVLATSDPTGITVRNGTVRNHPRFGVGLEGKGHRIEGVTARHSGDHGIVADPRSSCRSCVAIENGGDGIRLNSAAIVESSTASGNAGEGIKLRGSGGVVNGCNSSTNGGNGIQIDFSGGTVFGSGAYWNEGSGFSLVALSKFGVNNISQNNTATDSCGGHFCSENKRYYKVPTNDPCGLGFRRIARSELAAGQLAMYEGTGVGGAIYPDDPATERWGVSFGDGVGTSGSFECLDVNDIGGGSAGIRCSNTNLQQLTTGWHLEFITNPVLGGEWICIEE